MFFVKVAKDLSQLIFETQEKGSKWIVFSLESYFLAGLLGVYIHTMSPGCSLLNGSDLSDLSALLDLS